MRALPLAIRMAGIDETAIDDRPAIRTTANVLGQESHLVLFSSHPLQDKPGLVANRGIVPSEKTVDDCLHLTSIGCEFRT
jgi:hypothetical protein